MPLHAANAQLKLIFPACRTAIMPRHAASEQLKVMIPACRVIVVPACAHAVVAHRCSIAFVCHACLPVKEQLATLDRGQLSISIQQTFAHCGAPVKQEMSNLAMLGFSSCPTATRSSMLWYSSPSAPSTCSTLQHLRHEDVGVARAAG